MANTPIDQPASVRDILVTRAMITALGKALVKNNMIDTVAVLTEMTKLADLMPDSHAKAEMENVMKTISNW
jgi:hypothetical protein